MTESADVMAKLNAIKARAEKAKTEHARAEAMLESLEKQRQEIEAELATLGVAPADLENEIAQLEKEIEANLQQAEVLLSGC